MSLSSEKEMSNSVHYHLFLQIKMMPCDYCGNTLSIATSVQPYKYGGKELDRQNGLDWYDFEARQHDPMLLRFTSIDPMAEKYYSISPYAYCAGNPIRFVDNTGKIIEDPDCYIRKLSDFYHTIYRNLKNVASNPNLDKKTVSQINFVAAFCYAKSMALGELEASDQIYRIERSNDVAEGTAETYYNPASGKIITRINSSIENSPGIVAHENEHWLQFEHGELSFDSCTGDGGFLYDLQDEINAFNAQSVVENGIYYDVYDSENNKNHDYEQYQEIIIKASSNKINNLFNILISPLPYGKKIKIRPLGN